MLKRFANWFLQARGWTLVGRVPTIPKYVLIGPHTSNWDGWYLFWYGLALDLRPVWIGKHSLFRWPIKSLALALGGIPVDRSRSQDLVAQIAEEFGRRDQMVLAMAPEGTRSRVEEWRSGFYHIARAANVPVVLAVLDGAKKHAGFAEPMMLTGDIKADMDRVRAFYEGHTPIRPENAGPIRLKEERESQPG